MAYIPPLNGGRLNASISGNSTSAGAGYSLLSTGTMYLAGGNNITLSQNGASITISGANAPTASINFSAGTTSGNLNSINFSNSNGVSFGLNGSTITASHNAITNMNLSAGTTSNNLSAVTFSNANGVSFGLNGSVITGSHNAITNINVSAGTTRNNLSAITFNNGNGVSFGLNGSTMTASVAAQSAQTQSNIQAVIAGAATASTGTISFANSNGVSFGLNGNTLTASAAGGAGGGVALYDGANSISSGTARLSAGGALTASINGQTLSLNAPAVSQLTGAGAVTLSSNGSTVSISSPVMSLGMMTTTAGGGTGGTSGTVSNGLQLVAGTNISLSQSTNASGATVSIYGGAGAGGGTLSMYALGNTTQNTSASLDQRSVSLNGLGAMSVGYSNGSVQLSAPATSSIVGAGGVSISTNGSTISVSYAPKLSRWENQTDVFAPLNTAVPNSSLSVQPMYVPFNVTGSAMKIGGSMTVGTFTSATTASINITLWMGIYTLNGSTLSLASSGSANNGFTWRNTANSSQYASSYLGMREMTVPMNINMTPGQYWVAAAMATATNYTSGFSYTLYGNTYMNTSGGVFGLAPMGVNTTGGSSTNVRDAILYEGVYTAATTAGPSAISYGQLNNTGNSSVQLANFYNVIYNNTY